MERVIYLIESGDLGLWKSHCTVSESQDFLLFCEGLIKYHSVISRCNKHSWVCDYRLGLPVAYESVLQANTIPGDN